MLILAREVSPKYVFGKKKYGRRSRPENSGSEGCAADDIDNTECTTPCSTDNDSDTEESVPKKRRARACKQREVRTENLPGETSK